MRSSILRPYLRWKKEAQIWYSLYAYQVCSSLTAQSQPERPRLLAGQLSPQEALDEVATEWKKIVKRIGADTVREAYAIGVALEDAE